MPLILLRHSQPDIAPGVCYGRADLDLADDFENAAARILTELPPVARVVSSPLTRCLRLAETIATARGIGLSVEPGIVEFDFGRWERVPWTAIPREELDAWAADFDGARPHGGENVAMLRARVTRRSGAVGGEEPPELWVTHAGVIKAACAIRGVGAGWKTEIAFGGWLRLEDRNEDGPDQRVGTGTSPR